MQRGKDWLVPQDFYVFGAALFIQSNHRKVISSKVSDTSVHLEKVLIHIYPPDIPRLPLGWFYLYI